MERGGVIEKDIERHRRRIAALEKNQMQLVQLSYKGLISDEVLADEQSRLEAEKQKVENLLSTAQLHVEDVETTLAEALALATTPHATYLASSPTERRLVNQTFFKQLKIGLDGKVAGTTLTPVYAALAAWDESLGQPPRQDTEDQAEITATIPQGASRENPDPLSKGQGSILKEMVEAAGIEPASEVVVRWCLQV